VLTVTGAQQSIAGVDVSRPVLGPPADWTGMDAPTCGAVLIPDHIDPTNPRRVFELEDQAECKYLYAIVLADGTPADVNRLIDRVLLVGLWDRLYLPHGVRAAWAETVSSCRRSMAAATDSTPTPPSRSDRQHHNTPGRAARVRLAPAARTDGELVGPRRPPSPDDAAYGAVYGSTACG
jgi:hypothetical protein